MTDLFKKVFILLVLFLLVFAVYLIKNPDIKDGLLAKINIFNAEEFRISEDIEIEEKDINIDNLIEEEGEETEEQEENIEEEEKEENKVVIAKKREVRPADLKDIEKQIAEISEKVEKIEKEVKILAEINRIQKEINHLTERAGGLSVVSSI